jgi:hypothetical protein
MSVSVVKYGPYFGSGAISFSQLRSNFAERGSGEMRASDLRRNTNLGEENPIVPDSTENENISTGNNLSLSQFRNSIKRYVATQSGTDENSSYPGEPGFRMGRLDTAGKGIDWSGGGYFGRDGQGGGVTGNLTKNVQKGILITGTCGSVRAGLAGAQMAPIVQVHNVRIDVSGSILGYGGEGGTVQNGNAEDGATALNFGNVGNNCRLIVGSGARIYGGGGGGEKGVKGANGANGSCIDVISRSNCGGCPGCPSGYTSRGCREGGGCNRRQVCNWWGNCWWTTSQWNKFENCEKIYATAGGIGGDGGNGGRGRGYNNQGGPSNGSSGNPGTAGQGCFSGGSPRPAAQPGQKGGDGARGGDWGERGGSTDAPGNPGNPGNAVAKDGPNQYRIMPQSVINSNTIRGNIY